MSKAKICWSLIGLESLTFTEIVGAFLKSIALRLIQIIWELKPKALEVDHSPTGASYSVQNSLTRMSVLSNLATRAYLWKRCSTKVSKPVWFDRSLLNELKRSLSHFILRKQLLRLTRTTSRGNWTWASMGMRGTTWSKHSKTYPHISIK